MKDMGKKTEDKLKVIFKTSLTTLCTHSKTCSGISQLSTKSGILRIQKSLRKKHSYYVDTRGKVKRDFSVETDICVLRRFCRRKLNMTSNLGSSAKSRYSAVDTDVETIEEFPDASACGDNEIIEIRSNYPTNLECLMVDNLKNLLGQWIEKHLKSKKDTRQKLDKVFDCILRKLNDKSEQELSSDTTYVIHKVAQNQEVKNKKIATSFSCQYCKHKSCRKVVTSTSSQKDSSSAPIPGPNKDMRIISTLSIPRTFNKRGLDGQKKHTSSCKLGKIRRNNVILSIDKFNKLIDTTSFNLLAVSTKSLENRFQNCKNKKHIIFYPKPFYKSATCSANIIKSENGMVNNLDSKKYQLETLPSILRNLYKNESIRVDSSVDKNVQFDTKTDNFTMTDGTSREMITTDLIEENTSADIQRKYNAVPTCNYKNINCLTINKTTHTSTSHMKLLNKNSKKRGKVNKRRRQIFGNKISPNISKLSNLDSKHFTFMYETATKQILQGQDLLNYWQSLFQYFNQNNTNKKIKVDIHISLSPKSEYETKDTCTDISNEPSSFYEEVKGDATLLYNVKPETEPSHMPPIVINSQLGTGSDIKFPTKYVPEIIPLLDGAVSQAKYILDASSREKVEIKSNLCVDRGMMTNEVEILQEINELKLVIKDLAMTTEKLVSKQMRKDSGKSNIYASLNPSYNYTSSSRCEAVINLINLSKAIQVGEELQKNQIKSDSEGSKLKDTLEYYNRLTKKSTSFRIIDSESLLRVTDMTSKGNEINKFNRQFTDEALMCAIPKSLSLFDLPSERNKKLIAFFCDNCVKPKVSYRNSGRNPGRKMISRPKSSKSLSKKKKWHFWGGTPKNNDICCPRSTSGTSCVIPISNLGYSTTSSCCSENSMVNDEELGKPCKVTRGMGFGEGCMYCMLLWIPVLILGCLFYSHVLKNYVVSQDKVMYGKRTSKAESIPNSTVVYLKLSDLGF
ncbi:unnamed protein product [Arctia plantaginis]|uniref:Uncharacterized protein n=1 Tax=Arctia plantaginis TaxID=874455 RepID=A0A8S1AGU6_ARCPL|nr:unnamed protein product [Arctia plantaginis]